MKNSYLQCKGKVMTTFNKTISRVSPDKIYANQSTYGEFLAFTPQEGETEINFLEGKLIEVRTETEVSVSNCMMQDTNRMLIDGIDINAPNGKYSMEIAFNSNLGNLYVFRSPPILELVAVGEVFLLTLQPTVILEDQVRSREIIVSGNHLTSAHNFQFRRITGEGALIMKAFEQSKTENRVELRIITIQSAIKEGRYKLEAESEISGDFVTCNQIFNIFEDG